MVNYTQENKTKGYKYEYFGKINKSDARSHRVRGLVGTA